MGGLALFVLLPDAAGVEVYGAVGAVLLPELLPAAAIDPLQHTPQHQLHHAAARAHPGHGPGHAAQLQQGCYGPQHRRQDQKGDPPPQQSPGIPGEAAAPGVMLFQPAPPGRDALGQVK